MVKIHIGERVKNGRGESGVITAFDNQYITVDYPSRTASVVIDAFETRPVPTGIAIAFSSKWYAQIEERSSMAKLGIKKSGGVFDSGYRGEYLIVTYNTNKKPFIISKIAEADLADEFEINGVKYKKEDVIIYPYTKAICQVVMLEVPVFDIREISYEELKQIDSERGAGRFGSSKK